MVLHQAGQLNDAEALYREVLNSEPNHANALHLLGVLKAQSDNPELAVELISRAIAIDATNAIFFTNCGNALRTLNRLDEALSHHDRALALSPGAAGIHYNRGNVLRDCNRYDEALDSYDRALALQPDHAEAYFNRGNVQLESLRHEQAVVSYEHAIALKSNHAEAYCHRGNALLALKRPEQALSSFDAALQIKPDYVKAHSNRGFALRDLGRHEEALISYDRALALAPNFAQVHFNRANTLADLNRYEEALISYDRALTLKPDYSKVHYNRGNTLRKMHRYDDALTSYECALRYNYVDVDTYCNRGVVLQELNRHEDALLSFQRALTTKPDDINTHWNESLCQLLMGDFAAGWRNYEWRWQTDLLREHYRQFIQPLWLGEHSLADKTILLHAEQGFGDTLQFCRYVQQVKALGATVVLEVQPALNALLYSLQNVDLLITKGESLPDFNYHCPLLSLPLAFNTSLETIPADIPYLFCPTERVKKWQAQLDQQNTKPRIGLVWSGNIDHKNDHNRSIPLAQFSQLLNNNCARFFSLQRDLRDADAAILANFPEVQHFGEQLQDFADTAALIELMDLVISVDTSVAHLAGAMAKPVWVLLPHNPDWRWLLNRTDTPWYPTMRLFRQPAQGNWQSVLDQVNQSLQSLPSVT